MLKDIMYEIDMGHDGPCESLVCLMN